MKTTALMKLLLRLLRGDTERALLEVIDYLMVEVRVLRDKYEQDCGKRLLLTEEQRLELAEKGQAVIRCGHRHVIHDDDTKFAPFNAMLPDSVIPVKLSPRSPRIDRAG